MIYVLNLATGLTIIAQSNIKIEHHEQLDSAPYVTVYNPMTVERDQDGMRLRDYLMLSDNNELTFRSKDIISIYSPTQDVVDYYTAAYTYAIRYTRTASRQQIKAAIQDLQQMMLDEDEYNNRLVNILMKAGGSTLQ